MKKTYVTTMPNHIGAFLRASECFAELGINITRVSYNKAIDSHMLFIDVQGEEEKLLQADKILSRIGYLQTSKNEKSVILLEFNLCDCPGSVTQILKLIQSFELNISYMSSQENGTGFQAFKMGLNIDNEKKLKDFVGHAEKLCPVRILDYNSSEKNYDNSFFYQSFVSDIMKCMNLPESKRNDLLVNANLIMQILDDKGLPPYKTFESIGKFAHLLAKCRGENFFPRISTHTISDDSKIILIEPPCGSNTIILQSREEVLFIDSGYALYHNEMEKIFRSLLPDYDNMKKRILVTHADVDHCGLLSLFDEIITGDETAKCLQLEYEGRDGYREQNLLHRPYINICKLLTSYKGADSKKINIMWHGRTDNSQPLEQVGFFNIGELKFEVYIGLGGHLRGETILIDYFHHLVFSGDVYINVHGLTKEQAEYNQYAPVLMTSVDTDPKLCALERNLLLQRLGLGDWNIFGGHGMKRNYNISSGIVSSIDLNKKQNL